MLSGISAMLTGSGVLAIFGSAESDNIVVRQVDNNLKIDGLGCYPLDKVNRIVVNAGEGDDVVNLNRVSTVPAYVFGGAGDDVITGTSANDYIEGDDILDASVTLPLTGDFNGDHRTDGLVLRYIDGIGLIATTVFSLGNGNYAVVNDVLGNDAMQVFNASSGPLVGDFNGDGADDLAFVAQDAVAPGLNIVVHFSLRNGLWKTRQQVETDPSNGRGFGF
ncbi:Alkaline phosphatase [Thermogutta terrifontis]|uniref:Alkaline phosphatase n=1 Tax=Thermogutta terrifontis TaxID=1331910 RepID=A0A286RLJ0_9BACT|nr:hypothetical protein [Thermogutta terrifontis]ASV76826.1 Alkaline phosphatase [Thermogutta terrifontis]